MNRSTALLLSLLCLPAVCAAQTTTQTGVLSSCVSTRTGDLRLVYSAANCSSSEIFVQRNQQGPAGSPGVAGPSGPTGPAGPAGPGGAGLNNVFVVPSTGDEVADGASLAAVLSSNQVLGATATSPVVVRLDAGTYSPAAAIDIPAFVSLTGPGEFSTILTGTVTANKAGIASATQSISNLTFGSGSNQGTTLTVTEGVFGSLQIDHVQTTYQTPLSILYPGNYGTVTINNSQILSYTFTAAYSAPSKITSLIITASALYTSPAVSPSGAPVELLCNSDWSSISPVALTSACKNPFITN